MDEETTEQPDAAPLEFPYLAEGERSFNYPQATPRTLKAAKKRANCAFLEGLGGDREAQSGALEPPDGAGAERRRGSQTA